MTEYKKLSILKYEMVSPHVYTSTSCIGDFTIITSHTYLGEKNTLEFNIVLFRTFTEDKKIEVCFDTLDKVEEFLNVLYFLLY